MENQEKNWLQSFLSDYDFGYGEENFRVELASAYRAHFVVDHPEYDDEHFRDSLVVALGDLLEPVHSKTSPESLRFNSGVRWVFSLLALKGGRRELIKELRSKLKIGYASAQLQQLNLYWKKLEIDRARAKFEQDPLRINELRGLKIAEKERRIALHAVRKREIDWRYHEVGPIWGRDMSVSRFVERLKKESQVRTWHSFVSALEPFEVAQPTKLRDTLSQMVRKPNIYWYPGSGMDFKPLILDVPSNPTGRRLFRLNEPDFARDPILFCMNDHSAYLSGEPKQKQFKADYSWPLNKYFTKGDDRHYEKWGRYGAELCLAENREDYLYDGVVPVTLFTVRIKNEEQSTKNRPAEGDTYLVIFSNTASHVLFEEVIFPLRLNVVCTVLAAQGGFSHQLKGFEQYRDIPKLLRKCEDELGPVDLYLLDDQAHDGQLKRPNSPYIRHYEYVGGPVRIGWYPCRAFGRPGLFYQRESKPQKYSFTTN